jgi:hypothetical protein
MKCTWSEEVYNTTVIQMGDVVDRGKYSVEAWECLRSLQYNQARGNLLIRLVGSKIAINTITEYVMFIFVVQIMNCFGWRESSIIAIKSATRRK